LAQDEPSSSPSSSSSSTVYFRDPNEYINFEFDYHSTSTPDYNYIR
jgi:hypothetical protein